MKRTRCATWLWNQGSMRTGTILVCLCTDDCVWAWERRERGFWSPMAFWRHTAPEIGGDLWVRLPAGRSAMYRTAQERA